jgi:predicted metal-dependent peptidase
MEDNNEIDGATESKKLPAVSSADVKKQLQTTIYSLLEQDPFLGNLVQEVNLSVNNFVPTAYMGFNTKTLKFQMGVNPDYFMKISTAERVGVIQHELLHFLHLHLERMKFVDIPDHEKALWNVAADMAINQYIKVLPEGCVKVSDWKMPDGSDMPKYKMMEFYHENLKKSLEDKNGTSKDKKEGSDYRDDFQDRKNQNKTDEKGQTQWGTGPTNPNDAQYDKYKPFDQHDWEELSPEDKEKFLREMKDTFERTIEKCSRSFTAVPEHIKDLIRKLDSKIDGINYKAILKRAVRRSITVANRENTWKRPNKRYGELAPGSITGKLPQIAIYIDTSGSMSYREISESLKILEGFMKVGSKQCYLGLFNTSLYSFKKRKLNEKLNESDIQSGGTDLLEVINHIDKRKPDLALLLTDGYYGDVPHAKVEGTQIMFIIRNDNNLDHPLVRLGKTIPFSGIK